MDKITALAAEVCGQISQEPASQMELIVSLSEDIASLGRSITYLRRQWHSRGDTRPYDEHLKSKLECVVLDTSELIHSLGVADFGAAFGSEYALAIADHPDYEGDTNEARFYVLTEELGELASSIIHNDDHDGSYITGVRSKASLLSHGYSPTRRNHDIRPDRNHH